MNNNEPSKRTLYQVSSAHLNAYLLVNGETLVVCSTVLPSLVTLEMLILVVVPLLLSVAFPSVDVVVSASASEREVC